ncbi:MAG: SPOR domain-containing protein [Bacteroidetes bacterium]|nr:SPOR domain-containing protein [Bacteroidota bacterium]
MALEHHIHFLLFEHDCVILPGFGGFLAHYRPARLDQQRNLVHPPSKELSFNRHLVRQDGLLIDRLVTREGLDFNAAKHRVEEELAEWRNLLQRNGRLELPRIGTFFRGAENQLQFEPDRRVNYLKDAYGLRPVAAIPAVKQIRQTPVIADAGPMGEPLRQTGVRIPGWLAAAASVAILVTAATWWMVGSNGMPAGWAGFDLGRASEAALYVRPSAPPSLGSTPVEASIWTAPKDLYGIHVQPIAGPGAPMVAVNLGQAPAKAVPESTAVVTPSPGPRFHIIGGCFLEKENADRFVSELQAKGFAATLVDRKGGLYRVAYGSYPQREMALEALNAVRKEEAPQAWLLVK